MTPPTNRLQMAAATEFAQCFVTASLNRQLHAADSRFVADALRDMVHALRRAQALGLEMPLQLQLSDDCIHYEGQTLEGPSLQAKALLRHCSKRHIAVISFAPELDVDEANRCFDLLLLPANEEALSREHRDETLKAHGIRRIRFTLRSAGDPSNRRSAIPSDREALHRYQDLAQSLLENHALATRNMELAVDIAAGSVERTLTQLEEPSLLLSLATQDDVDRFTVGHSVRVALLALQVARSLGTGRSQLVHVGTAALLHDIGKSKVPQEVLFKQGKLDADEWRWMAQHPRLGAHLLLEQHEDVGPHALGAAFCHHMGPTGCGYPTPALPFAPSGISRLIRVCDVFEALTSVRPYKRALTPLEAYAVMFRNERDFDPHWLRRFVRALGLFPTGTRVLLDDGAEAIVVDQTDLPQSPVVRLLTIGDGAALPIDHPEIIRLGVAVDGVARRIKGLCMHDRCLAVPAFDSYDPQILTTAGNACLSMDLARDAATINLPKST